MAITAENHAWTIVEGGHGEGKCVFFLLSYILFTSDDTHDNFSVKVHGSFLTNSFIASEHAFAIFCIWLPFNTNGNWYNNSLS